MTREVEDRMTTATTPLDPSRRWAVTYRRKIRFSDTDAQGIVFNPNYARYVADTVDDFTESPEPVP